MRTLATEAEETVLVDRMVRGSTWPEKRSTSTLLLTPICFSPVIIRWPLGNTAVTTAVMLPLNSLVFWLLPLPAAALPEVAATEARASAVVALMPGRAVTLPDSVPVRSSSLLELWVVLMRSTIWMVTVSPTLRAR
jgi:hypothetical protein